MTQSVWHASHWSSCGLSMQPDVPHQTQHGLHVPLLTQGVLHVLHWKTYVCLCFGAWHVPRRNQHVFDEPPLYS